MRKKEIKERKENQKKIKIKKLQNSKSHRNDLQSDLICDYNFSGNFNFK